MACKLISGYISPFGFQMELQGASSTPFILGFQSSQKDLKPSFTQNLKLVKDSGWTLSFLSQPEED